jgi:hypothetical protein
MPRLTIRLRCDPATGKEDIIVSYHSDADALPQEHEQQHRALVEKLIDGGLLKASEVGRVVVERERELQPADLPQPHSPAEPHTHGQEQS